MKYLRMIITVPLLLAVLFSLLLLFTHTGNVWLWKVIEQQLEPLEGELVAGELLSGWTFKNLRWQDESITFNAETLVLKWNPVQLINRQLIIDLLDVEKARITLRSDAKTSETPTPEQTTESLLPPIPIDIAIPIDIVLGDIRLKEISLGTEAANVTLGTLTASAELLNNHLTIDQFQVEKISLGTEAANVTLDTLTARAELLNNHLTIDQFQVEKISLGTEAANVTLGTLTASAELLNNHLTIPQFQVGKISLGTEAANVTLGTLAASAELFNNHLTIPQFLVEKISLGTEAGNVTLDTLTASAELLNNHLTIPQILADQLHLQITDTGNNAHKNEKEGATGPIFPLIPPGFQLPDITLPLPVTLKQLVLTNGLYRQGEQEETIQRLSLKFHGQGSAIDDIELVVNHRLAEASLTGSIHFDKAWPLKAVIQARIAEEWDIPDLDIPELQGLAGEQISLHASGDLNRLNLALTTQGAIAFSLKGHISPLAPTLPFDLTLDWQALQWPLVAKQPELSVSNGHLNLTGSLEQYRIGLQTRLMLPDRPEIDLALSALGTLAQLKISALKIQPKTGDAISSDNALDVAGILKWQQGLHWQGHATVTQFTPEVWLPEVSGMIDGKLAMSFALDNDQWRLKIPELSLTGRINDVPLNVQTDLEASSALTAAPLPEHLTIRNFSAAVGDNRLTINGTINEQLSLAALIDIPAPEQIYPGLKGKLNGTVNLAGRYQHPTLAFHLDSSSLVFPLQPDNLTWQGMLSGTGDIRWQHGTPIVNLDVQFPPGKLESGSVNLRYQQLALALNLDENQLKGKLDMKSQQLGVAHIDLTVADIQTDQKLSGAFRLKDLNLNVLAPFIPQLTSLEGTLESDATMGGTLKNPLLFGEFSLSDGQLTARADMVKVTHLGTRLTVNGNRGELSGSLRVGEGKMKLAGHLDWQELPVTGLITMKGERLQVKVPGIVQLQASPDLQFTLGDTQKLTGTITIPEARVAVEGLPKQAITPSDDVVIVTSDTEPEPEVRGAVSQFTMDVRVVLGSDIKIDAYGLKADLGGRLLLGIEPGKSLTANGSIHLLEGRYKQFGQDLLIKEGDIIFSGPLTSPYLSVNVFRNPDSVEDGVLVGIELEGSLTHPEFTIYSDPVMEQQEQWSYLLRGQGLKVVEEEDEFALQSLLVGFGVGQIGGVVSTLGEAIGLSNVTLDTEGSGEDTQVVIGGNINRHLQVQYGAGVFSSIASLKVRYELIPRLYLQVVSGVAQTLDLLYQFKIETGQD